MVEKLRARLELRRRNFEAMLVHTHTSTHEHTNTQTNTSICFKEKPLKQQKLPFKKHNATTGGSSSSNSGGRRKFRGAAVARKRALSKP